MEATRATVLFSHLEKGPDSKELRTKCFRSLLPWKAEEAGPIEADIRKRLLDFVSKGVLSVSQSGMPSGTQGKMHAPRGDAAWPPPEPADDEPGGWP